MPPRFLLVYGLMFAGGLPCQAQVDPTPPPPDLQPTFPIPTGDPREWNQLRFEWSPAGATTRHGRYADGHWLERAVGRSGGFRSLTPAETTEFRRTHQIIRWNSTGSDAIGFGVQHELFIADQWSGTFEVEATTGGPRFAARLTYFPFEGEAVGVGFDTRSGPVLFVQRGYTDDELAEAYFFHLLPAYLLYHKYCERYAGYKWVRELVAGRGE